MKKFTYFILVLGMVLFSGKVFSQGWQKVEGRIQTTWAEQVQSDIPWPEYPRPQMKRENWMNLNGLWDYAIQPRNLESFPSRAEGKILVPFAIESALSGVGKQVGESNFLWYSRVFSIPASFKNKTTLLHFGAVDWQCSVYVNGNLVGEHEGGYDPGYSLCLRGTWAASAGSQYPAW